MSAISLRNVSKTYGKSVEAVRNFSLDIEEKEFLCLLGPSGCGKSTIMRMVAGLETISSGEISMGGRVVNDVAPRDRDIAMIFENYALYPHLTVFDNIATPLWARKVPKDVIKNRVHHAAEVLEIVDLLPKRVRSLSGGQKQRVGIGRAIVRDPAVFLMDEPISHLDAQLRTSLRGELKRLHVLSSATTIYVTHDQLEGMAIADRIVVMKQGVLQQVGTPRDLFDRPVNLFVAGFIGSPPMNTLPCELMVRDGSVMLEGDGFALRLDGEMATHAARAGSRSLVFGVRSIDLTVVASKTDEAHTISGTAMVWEPLGDHAEVEVRVGGRRVTAAVDPRALGKPNEPVDLQVDMSRIHLFDAIEGISLLGGATQGSKVDDPWQL